MPQLPLEPPNGKLEEIIGLESVSTNNGERVVTLARPHDPFWVARTQCQYNWSMHRSTTPQLLKAAQLID